jgi:outer membrane immunogenic protein
MVAAIYDWSGFYIGGNGGWARAAIVWISASFLTVAARSSGGPLVASSDIAGRPAPGCSVSKLGDWADLSNTRVAALRPAFSTRMKTDGIGLFTGQIGWAWNTALFYVKGGFAVTSNRFSILDTFTR